MCREQHLEDSGENIRASCEEGNNDDTVAVRIDSEAVATSGLIGISCRQRYDANPNII